MKILKFGGSSLATPERIRQVVEIVGRAVAEEAAAVVVSALGGVTDDLEEALRTAAEGGDHDRAIRRVERRHLEGAASLAPAGERGELTSTIETELQKLRSILHGISLVREYSARTRDTVLSLGERLSAPLVCAAFHRTGVPAEVCDARQLVVTDDAFGRALVDFEITRQRIEAWFGEREALQVVTGFIGSTPAGETTTLGRGGSDYTAALFGAALDASAVELWTDVDGLMSADPRQVPRAFSLERLSYQELLELSHFGAKVVHPPSVQPVHRRGVPLWIKNTLNPDFPGTLIETGGGRRRGPVCGVSSISAVTVLNLEGDGMVGVPGIAMRLFGALAREGISVILISQASSEHSICLAVASEAAAAAKRSIEREFELERRVGLIDDLGIEPDQTVIAAVGDGMREVPGVAGKLFRVLGQNGINVRAIAQGSSERNISLVVSSADERRALNALHDAFFFSPSRVADLFVLGTGQVARSLLRQLAQQRDTLAEHKGWHLNLRLVANSRKMLLGDSTGISPAEWEEHLERQREEAGLDRLRRAFTRGPYRSPVVVDCTASDEVPSLYPQLLASRFAVVAANKRGLAATQAEYRELMEISRRYGAPLRYEATVGAGLPVISTLRDLVATGDRVHRILGVLSGSIAFILDRLAAAQPFSAAVREAQEIGYTEPDPRDDLGGMDVARKLLILAREAGLELELEEVEVEPFVDQKEWAGLPIEEFWAALPELDQSFAARQGEAAETGGRLCYLARLEGGRASVALTELPTPEASRLGSGSDNSVAFYTDRYTETPLVVQGAGAGPAVTAAGVFADILHAIAEAD